MNTEQLQMLIEAASSAGQGAIWIVLAWFAKDLLTTLILVGGFVGLVWKVATAISAHSSADTMARDLARELGVSNFDTWHAPDRRRLRERIAELVRTQEQTNESR